REIASAGDVDDDGIPDLAIGAPFANTTGADSGELGVFSGANGAPILGVAIVGGAGYQLGYSVAGCGDIDKDGFDDVLAGAPGAGADKGTAFVFSGKTHAILRQYVGLIAGDRFGSSVSGVGDANNDSWLDVVIGSPKSNSGFEASVGVVRVFSGLNSAPLVTSVGFNPNDQLGTSVAGVGDVNADGFDDFAAGAPFENGFASASGVSRIYSGNGGAVLHAYLGPPSGAAHSGWRLAGVGDANGDGRPDVVVGAPDDDTLAHDAGSAVLWSGINGAIVHTYTSDAAGKHFGAAVTLIDDVNADGVGDVLVGIPDDEFAGSARVYSGLSGALLRTHVGESLGDRFGAAVASVGDLDADGRDEYAISSPLGDNVVFVLLGTDAGRIRIVNGATGETHMTLSGGTTYDGGQMGFSVAGAGDVNLDGIPDVIAGAPFSAVNGVASGRAAVYSGATGGTLFTISGDSANDTLGWSVAGMGDVDGDGRSDVVVGAPNDETGLFVNTGAVWMCSGLNGATLHKIGLFQTGARWGESVCGLGDVNADGVPDYVAGAPGWDSASETDAGAVFVCSGVTGTSIYQVEGSPNVFGDGERLGASIARVADMNNDGRDDFVAGAPGYDSLLGTNYGRVRVFSGKDGLALYGFVGLAPGDALGTSVGGGFDLDHDGHGDAVAGAPNADPAGADSGMARTWSLAPAGLATFGIGTPGCTGAEIAFANSVPKIGNADFQLNVSHVPPSALSLGLIADQKLLPGADLFGVGVVLHLDLATSTTLLPVDVVADPLGFAAGSVPLPLNPALVGATLYFQTISSWGNACVLPPFGLSSSHGLSFTVQ
ncbi:MAG TPA: hypothetical protein VKE69_00715, partial [Planctomycetota bacterium]|nr:hypothetical protein [Planctomycetota bacterium]